MNVLYEIEKRYNNFSDKEKSIANYILQQSEKINNINLNNILIRICSIM